MEVHYINHEEYNVEVGSFDLYLEKIKKELKLKEGVLNVVFVNDSYIQALNKTYREKDKPTDVLSFNYSDEGSDLVGEIYISIETAKKQSVDHMHSFYDELIKLIIHGILHVHGYDHEEDEEYREMFSIEKKVLGKIAGELMI